MRPQSKKGWGQPILAMGTIICSAINTTIAAVNAIANGATVTPMYIHVVDPWLPNIDTWANIAGDNIDLLVRLVQLCSTMHQLDALMRLENGKPVGLC